MIFGPKFYPALDKMTNWRQSLYALVLATRQYRNFTLWTELEERQGASEFRRALQQCWMFHFDRFNRIDLTEVFEQIAPYIPDFDARDESEINEGERFAFDAAISLNAAVDAIVIDTDDEAVTASKASMASVIRLCENRYPDEELDEETLHDKEEIESEINFQVELFELVTRPRTHEQILSLLRLALRDGVSNIGLESDLTEEDFKEAVSRGRNTEAPAGDEDSGAE